MTKDARRSGLALPSNFLAFCHDKFSRCRAIRIVSRQQRRANRVRINPARRRSVQRGFRSAPATGDKLLGVARCGLRDRGRGNLWAKGAAAAALIQQRRGAIIIVTVQPVHHRLRPPPGAFSHFSGTVALSNFMQSQKTLPTARMAGAHRQVAQIGRSLSPALVFNV